MTSRSSLPSLLLLPAPPAPASVPSLSAAYRPSLRAAILRARSPTAAAFLVVALVAPILTGSSRRSKVLDWKASQSLLAGLYGLIAVICAEDDIASDIGAGKGAVDIRIVLVDSDEPNRGSASPLSLESNNTVVVNLRTFAHAYHPWNLIMHIDGEAGHSLRASFLEHAQGRQVIRQDQFFTAEGGISIKLGHDALNAQKSADAHRGYQTVCLGGTFDHLHPGHKLLLTAALLLLKVPEEGSGAACKLIVGVTGDALLRNKKFAQYVQPWSQRAAAVVDFVASVVSLHESGWTGKPFPGQQVENESSISVEAFFRERTIHVHCVEIQDAFGPTITDEHVDALVVSGETRSGGQAVNDKRTEMGWKALDVYEVDVLGSAALEDAGERSDGPADYSSKISSSTIRQQKADAAASTARNV
ncbi:hypothetical protein VD0002_g9682 [Verticillium dahliae]|uniref:Cytidyltransferase-like domain-containing protein n=1 Tax=Verticillium dahliae TaxID=27337 RepID=A0A2J8CDE7_VERDA|nr:hypothetical protein VdG2_06173 [Verticillium dahliae VDG2]KAF3355224.1 Protein MNN4 [Verticillium dahliae VDG1]KAH6708167.1 pantetheine-phosphate adenylyltransferase family protein [Verticillium dahliae]PNH35043.1 hypothetical protein BJF96_g1633 [Verticillium dahliae]PNH37075.1 hypothetical protein VD0004_g9694 [Verticillium dahliae]